MFKLDWKSVLFGALLAVCVMIFFGANGQSENPDSLPSPKYQISAYSLSDNSGVFVINTQTGEMYRWQDKWHPLHKPQE